jgi:hypothetical protein
LPNTKIRPSGYEVKKRGFRTTSQQAGMTQKPQT